MRVKVMKNKLSGRKEAMTSRERVIKAVNHEPVDRMPIDLGSTYDNTAYEESFY
jgi:hypothetical protein